MKVSKILTRSLLFTLILLTPNINYGQLDLIEVDSVSKQFTKVVPIDKPFIVKYKIERGNISKILFIKKMKGSFLGSSIKSGILPSIDKKYWSVTKEGESKYLYINFTDNLLFKPSDSYFVIPIFKNIVNEDVFEYFQAINIETNTNGSNVKVIFNNSNKKFINKIKNFEKGIFDLLKDSTTLTSMTSEILQDSANFSNFLIDTNFVKVNKHFDTLKILQKLVLDSIKYRNDFILGNIPNFNVLTTFLITDNAMIKDDVALYLLGPNGSTNKITNILQYFVENEIFGDLSSGLLNINCINCTKIDGSSLKRENYEKRLINLDTLFKEILNLRAILNLLKPKMVESDWKIEINKIDNFIKQINNNKKDLTKVILKRKEIDEIIFSEIFDGHDFFTLDILSGNSIMSFEARNKLTLVPEFGLVTSAFNKKGKQLEYGIIPYLGFSINFMGINKDVKYNSYDKDWRQKWSFGVGWSLVNMNRESIRASFFEKGSFLTGLSFRINNIIKITSGAQMYFELSEDMMGNELRKLEAIPYLGFSFDLSVKDFLGGFLDIIPGINKTKNITFTNN